ncbi:MAG: hypothetical protein QOJ59_354 [Thermomicrobiales bacterium]|jgi:hypothetical protein|nr:hypothetical protein [Thermomicrobiales bacterium]MEA2525262.1 hypothetical protein [Thermomicrobiales bacterium]
MIHRLKTRAAHTCALGLVLAGTLGVAFGGNSAGAAPITCTSATPAETTATVPPTGATPSTEAIPTQAPVGQEQNPPGDIPDNQAFVPYASADGGYTISMPEGWARQEDGPNVTFSDKLHVFSVEITCADAPPTVESAKNVDVPALAQKEPAFALVDVTAVDLPAGPAVLIKYQANSAPDEVTGKQIRLDVERYELFKDGKLAAISLRVPAGSDNVDVSNMISRSFQWTA